MYTTDIAKERIPEKVTLEFVKRLVEIVNDDPDDFNSYYLNACHWEDLLQFFIKLKALYIVYARLKGKIDLLPWAVEGNPLRDAVYCSDNLDYETIGEGLMDLRWSTWNPDECSTELDLSDAIQELTSEKSINVALVGLKIDTATTEEEIHALISQVDDLTDTAEPVLENATSEHLLELLSQNDLVDSIASKSTFFQRYFKCSIDPADWTEAAEFFAKFWREWAEYDISKYGAALCIRKLPWIHKVLTKQELLAKNEVAFRLIQNEIDNLVSYGYCCCGKQGIYCIEMVMDTEESYEHYPSLFTPFKLTVLEMLAKEIYEANDEQFLPDVTTAEERF